MTHCSLSYWYAPALNVTVDEVEQVLEQIASAGLWLRYEVDQRYYLAIPP